MDFSVGCYILQSHLNCLKTYFFIAIVSDISKTKFTKNKST